MKTIERESAVQAPTPEKAPRAPRLVKAWEAKARVVNVSIKAIGPEGITMVLDDVGEVKGFGPFPDGTLVNTCNAIRNPWPDVHPSARSGANDNAVIRTADGETITYKTVGVPGQLLDGGLRRGISALHVWTMSTKYAWMNKMVFVRDAHETGDAPDQSWEGTIYQYSAPTTQARPPEP